MSVTIRCNESSRSTLKNWCSIKNVDMPELIDAVIDYVERKKQQSFYNGLPKVLNGKHVTKKCIRR